MEKTLVYLASGGWRPGYENLDYSRIYLVDNHYHERIKSDKIIPLHMDVLEAFEYFKLNNIVIDCLVCLCESRGEGGQTYAMCSDVIMGYYMQILPDSFIWICNDTSYYGRIRYEKGKPASKTCICYYDETDSKFKIKKMRNAYGQNVVSLDLPYEMTELSENDEGYISPTTFSSLLNDNNKGHVFRMHYSPVLQEFPITERIKIRILQDSIWNHYEELDAIYISFKLEYWNMMDYFERIPKVFYYKQMEFEEKLHSATLNGYHHIGFTPHYLFQYDKVYQKQLEGFVSKLIISGDYCLTIDFYYLSSWFHTRHIQKAIKTLRRSF